MPSQKLSKHWLKLDPGPSQYSNLHLCVSITCAVYPYFMLSVIKLVISHIRTNLDLSRSLVSFLFSLSLVHSCPIHVHLACLTTSHPSVYILMFFSLLFCISLSCSTPYLDFAWLISFSTWQTHIHMHTNSTKCVSLLLSSPSFIPISMSPLPLTHFYYSHRSLPLTLWPPLASLFVSVFMSRVILRASGWHRHTEEVASVCDEVIGGNLQVLKKDKQENSNLWTCENFRNTWK